MNNNRSSDSAATYDALSDMIILLYYIGTRSICPSVDRSEFYGFSTQYHRYMAFDCRTTRLYYCMFYRPTVCRSPICAEIHETRRYCADYYIYIIILLRRDT